MDKQPKSAKEPTSETSPTCSTESIQASGSELDLEEQNKQLAHDLSNQGCHKRIKIFYGDPSAEKATLELDAFAYKLMAAVDDEKNILHKTLGKDNLTRLLERYIAHLEFRAKLDWSKEQYYEQGRQEIAAANPGSMNVYVGGGYAERESVPIYG